MYPFFGEVLLATSQLSTIGFKPSTQGTGEKGTNVYMEAPGGCGYVVTCSRTAVCLEIRERRWKRGEVGQNGRFGFRV
jgi:hypothetical protein